MRTLNGSGRFGWRQFVVFLLGTCLCWGPMFTAQAQVLLVPAQEELARVIPLMNNAKSSDDLITAIEDGTKTIGAAELVNKESGGKITPLVTTAVRAYVKASIKLITQFTGDCEKSKSREKGRAAKTRISNLEEGVGKYLDKADIAAIKQLKTRIEKCLLPPPVFKGTGTSTFETGTSLTVIKVDVTWTLNTFLPPGSLLDISSYTPSGTITVNASEGDCKGSGKFDITAGLLIITLDNEVAAPGMPVGDFYEFGLATTSILTLNCPKGGTYPISPGALSSADAVAITRIDVLSGSQTQDGASSSWSFKAASGGKP